MPQRLNINKNNALYLTIYLENRNLNVLTVKKWQKIEVMSRLTPLSISLLDIYIYESEHHVIPHNIYQYHVTIKKYFKTQNMMYTTGNVIIKTERRLTSFHCQAEPTYKTHAVKINSNYSSSSGFECTIHHIWFMLVHLVIELAIHVS
jgi:hypothetical protein